MPTSSAATAPSTTSAPAAAATARSESSDSRSTTHSLTGILPTLDPSSLPPSIRETIQSIGELLSRDYSMAQIARELGITEERVAARVQELRDWMIEQAMGHVEDLPEALQLRVRELSGRGSTAGPAGGALT